jgi:glycosyltransferase involved in cell wall biosynthesis
MSGRSLGLSIIIPTRNRVQILTELLESIRQLDDVGTIRPEVIVADNNSNDDTYNLAASLAINFPTTLRVLKVVRPGKSAAMNEALRTAQGEYLAFLDDDVVVDRGWLRALEAFLGTGNFQAGQGKIGLRSPEADDPETRQLISRYRTIPHLDHGPDVKEVRSLNGANFFIARGLLDRLGGFDERLGPGASGTSEDVELAHRLAQAGIRIGYARDCIAYHRIDRTRLCDDYFQHIHRRQGLSRLLIKDRSYFQILGSLGRAYLQYFFCSLVGDERRRYRSLGRIFHYREMAHAKRSGAAPKLGG